jgi:peroxiredoxin
VRRLALALLLAAGQALAQAEMPSSDPLFAATLHDLDDKPAALANWRGKPLVVNFWARWCGPCRVEIPEFLKARAKYKARGAEVLGLGLEDKPEAVREFAKAYEMDYPVLLAKEQGIALMQALGNPKAGLPFTLAIDRRGKVVYKKLGGMKPADIEAAFDAALK